MDPGAPLNLQCPACGHVFMALQSRADAVVSCAHCAQTGQLGQFRAVAVADRMAAARRLPPQRRVPRHLAPEHDYSQAPMPPAPLPVYSPQPAPHAAPPPHAQPPVPSPMPAQQPGQPFTWNPTPAQTAQQLFNQGPAPAQVPGIFSPPQQPPPPAIIEPPALPPVEAQPFQFSAPELPRIPELPAIPPPAAEPQPMAAWPGLGKIDGEDALSAPVSPPGVMPPPATNNATPGGLTKTARTPAAMGAQPMAAKEPPKRASFLARAALFLLMSVSAAFTGLLVKEQLAARKAAAKGRAAPPPAPTETPHPAVKPEPPANRDFVTDRATRANAAESIQNLVRKLFDGATIEEKLACVSQEREARDQLAAVFDPAAPPLVLHSMKELPMQPVLLPENERIPVFAIITSANSHGALARLSTDAAGTDVIFWPLFHETHQNALTKFISTKSPEPGWFHVGLRRVHGFDLPESEKDGYHAIDVDGSTDGSGHIVTYVSKTTPVGRYLDAELQWGTLYLGQLLLGWIKTGGFDHITILDCHGANIEGRALPSEETIAPALPASAPANSSPQEPRDNSQ